MRRQARAHNDLKHEATNLLAFTLSVYPPCPTLEIELVLRDEVGSA